MSDENPNPNETPLHEWLPQVLLTFLVFFALMFVVYQMTVGMGDRDLGDKNLWALLVAMVLMLLLPVVDRIQTISASPSGFEATLSEVQAQGLEEVVKLVKDPETVETAKAQIVQAKSPVQVQAAVSQAVAQNAIRMAETVKEAIRDKRQCYVRYQPVPDEPVQSYHVAPLDIKPGKSQATKTREYLWAYSYEHESIVSLRMDRVMGIELSEETFDLSEVMAGRKEQPEWNVERAW